ncbi:hypothetical protein Pelo_548 [Pelomyxa schiedti]|nr:hypothetical protein Pelo_548 [Pelomyxa schiedti]
MMKRRGPSADVGLCARQQFVALAAGAILAARQWVVAPSRTITLKFQATSPVSSSFITANTDEEEEMYPTLSVVVVVSPTLGLVSRTSGSVIPVIHADVVGWIAPSPSEPTNRNHNLALVKSSNGALAVKDVIPRGCDDNGATVAEVVRLYGSLNPLDEVASRGRWIVVCRRSNMLNVWNLDKLSEPPAPKVLVDLIRSYGVMYNPLFVDDNSVAVIQEPGIFSSGKHLVRIVDLVASMQAGALIDITRLSVGETHPPLCMWCVDERVFVSVFENDTTQKILCVTTEEKVATVSSRNPIAHAWSWYYTLTDDDGHTTVHDVRATNGGCDTVVATFPCIHNSGDSRFVANGIVVEEVSPHSVALFDGLCGVHICTLNTDLCYRVTGL